MTPEEIKKIAEEYADKHYMCGCFSVDGEFRVNLSDLRYFYETLLSDLTERFYLVEKGKAEQEYQYSKKSYERNKGDEGYFEGYWEGRVDSYEDIFGPDIRKEEEE